MWVADPKGTTRLSTYVIECYKLSILHNFNISEFY